MKIDGYITNKKYFKMSEFLQENDSRYQELDLSKIDIYEFLNFIEMLDELREWLNDPLHVNSGNRPEYYNDVVLPQKGYKSSKVSRHKWRKGNIAVDLRLPKRFFNENGKPTTKARKQQFLNNIKDKWIELCKKYGFSGAGFGKYNTFFHVDVRTGANGKWNKGYYQEWDFSDYK